MDVALLATWTSPRWRGRHNRMWSPHRELAVTITVLTTEVETVATRAYLMDYLRDDPNIRTRLALLELVDRQSGDVDPAATGRALTPLDAARVCVPSDELSRIRFVRDDGDEPALRVRRLRCLRRGERPASDVT